MPVAYDEALAGRVRALLAAESNVTERKMFGGLCLMIGGNMCCGVQEDKLMVRVGPERHEAALGRPGARPMDFTGRPMRGMVYVDAAAIHTDDDAVRGNWP